MIPEASPAGDGRVAVAAAPPVLPYALLAVVVAALWLVPPAATVAKAAIIVGFAIVSWTFALFAEPITTLVFFLLAALFAVAKPAVIFSGFATTAWWLMFGGSITAVAVETTGLGSRLAGLMFGRLAGSYAHAVTGVALAAVGLAFVMPSTTGRVLLLMPIVLAFAERLGLGQGRPGRTGLVLTAAAASYMPATAILPANVPNTILLGGADALYGVKLTYGPYFLLHFPILGALKTVLLIWLVCRLFPERAPLAAAAERDFGPLSRAERRLAWLLAVSLLLFATDFIHGISPAWIALGTGIACLMPGIDIVPVRSFNARGNVVSLVYIAGILGMAAVVAESGLSAAVSAALLRLAHLAPGATVTDVASLGVIGAALSLLTTVTAVPAVLTPLAGGFAAASGLPILSVLMLQVVVFSTVLLPYELPPMMIALQLGRIGVRDGAKICLAAAALTILVLLPLDYLWWRLLGYLP